MSVPARVLKAMVPPPIRAPRLADSIGRWAAQLVLAVRAGPPAPLTAERRNLPSAKAAP
jgi:hypothetical protein